MTDMMRLVHCSDRALLVYLGDRIAPDINQRVHALAHAISEINHPAILEVTPSYHCILVEYDSVRLRPEQLESYIRGANSSPLLQEDHAELLEIPVLYGGEAGPDLEALAAHTSLPLAEVIRRHAQPLYRVYCLGFSPGFGYMGGLDPTIQMPRLAEPRIRVPSGSVGIGGSQTGIYPTSSPGGWNIIGRTPLQMFDPYRNPPALLKPGSAIRFVPIESDQFDTPKRDAPHHQPLAPIYTKGKTGLRILQPGLLTTVQDLGRQGFLAYGVPTAGAADFWSLMTGNWLLGNRARTAALEITLVGPDIEFTGPAAFCLTGAPISAELIPAGGGSPHAVPGWTALLAGPGDRLRMGATAVGCRCYLCIAGGFDLEPVLGSLSEDLFAHIGPFGRSLQTGDWLPIGLPVHPPAHLAGRSLPPDAIPPLGDRYTIRVTRGPQADAFSAEALHTFFHSEYVVGQQSNRQGLRLQGAALSHLEQPDILSEPNPSGSIQVPANGQPILLLRNRHTAGGYAKIAVAVYTDVAIAGQSRPGDRILFHEVDLTEAHAIARADRRLAAQVRRYLERNMAVPTVMPQHVYVQLPLPYTEEGGNAQTRPLSPGRSRTFRVTVSGVTFEATVEEVP